MKQIGSLMNLGVIQNYKKYLPVNKNTPIITMGEGQTPLIKSTNIINSINCSNLYFKFEGCNPTGSFKDRGMVFAIAKALETKSKIIACASTGNTSASAAAYGARFGLKTIVIVPNGKIASGKLAQAIAYGAKIISIDGNFDQGLSIIRELSENKKVTIELVRDLAWDDRLLDLIPTALNDLMNYPKNIELEVSIEDEIITKIITDTYDDFINESLSTHKNNITSQISELCNFFSSIFFTFENIGPT